MAANRLTALDDLRGLSVVGMLLVTNPGAWEMRWSWLDHAAWYGTTAADMVFPTFLFCVGMAMTLSFAHRMEGGAGRGDILRHLYVRALLLIVIGVLVNAWPGFDWAHVRIPGILQRIGICAAIGGTVIVPAIHEGRVSWPVLAIVAAVLLVSYWLLCQFVPVPAQGAPHWDSINSLPAVVDRAVFGLDHMWPYGTTDGKVTYDPEGILSTVPACFNLLVGAAIGSQWERWKRPMMTAAGLGVVLVVLGLAASLVCPIAKKIWTPSFALFSTGVSLVCLAALAALAKAAPQAGFPLRVFGANALLAFLISMLAGPFFDMPAGSGGVRYWSFHQLNAVIPDPHVASLVFSLIVVSAIFAVLLVCWKKRWFWRL